ncbi:MAG: hypothetical protein IPN53_25690 [Comamonadaceae bacterium]|nr:hypothetical protein [Comamonadaceae bacterium]
MFIERHEYTGPEKQPYIPGSSFKGAVHTAWLDATADNSPAMSQFKFNGEAKSTQPWKLVYSEVTSKPARCVC